jgi:hypothetical protein
MSAYDAWSDVTGLEVQDDSGRRPSNIGIYLFDETRPVIPELVYLSMAGQVMVRVVSEPVYENGKAVDVKPILQVRPSADLNSPVGQMYFSPGAMTLNYCRFWGTPSSDKDSQLPVFHFLDQHHPAVVAKCREEGTNPGPTFSEIVWRKAESVVAGYPQFSNFLGSDDERNNAIRKGRHMTFLQCALMQHPKVECDVADPVPAILMLSKTAAKSYYELLLAEREGYVYPEGTTYEWLSTRDGVNGRFLNGDLADPQYGRAVIFAGHSQKRRSKNSLSGSRRSGGDFEGSHYVAELTDQAYPMAPDLQAIVYNNMREMFWFPTPEETRDLILGRADDLFADFIRLCLKGSELEVPVSVQPGGYGAPQGYAQAPTPPASQMQQTGPGLVAPAPVAGGVQVAPPAPAPQAVPPAPAPQAAPAPSPAPAPVPAPAAPQVPPGAPQPGFQQPSVPTVQTGQPPQANIPAPAPAAPAVPEAGKPMTLSQLSAMQQAQGTPAPDAAPPAAVPPQAVPGAPAAAPVDVNVADATAAARAALQNLQPGQVPPPQQ